MNMTVKRKGGNTGFVFLWEQPDGTRQWEAIEDGQVNGFLKTLIEGGVHPATIMVAYAPILFHWVAKDFHKITDVNFFKINEEIYGSAQEESKHRPVNIPREKEPPKPKFGWLAPDGRFFNCEYGAHSHAAKKIAGELIPVPDPERYLEDNGWARVFSGTITGRRYAIGMGAGKKLTDEQLKALQSLGLDNAYGLTDLL